jgi:hypothetical protein
MDPVTLTWLEPLTPVGDEEIATVEMALGVRFPDDYRAFLRNFQGGTPAQTDFALNDPRKSTAAVGVFLSVEPERDYDYILSAARELSDQFPKGIVPIASGPGGDAVVLDFRGAKPVVLYWHHERTGREEFTFLADTFNEFLELLYEPEVESESQLD